MAILTFLLVVVILVLIVNIRSSVSARITELHGRIDALTAELRKARTSTRPDPTAPENRQPAESLPGEVPISQVAPKRPDEVKTPFEKQTPIRQPSSIPTAQRPPKAIRPGFFERNPDLEKFIGENLANKIGIGILVLGIGFFVKYAIDQDWINEIGRVFIGVLCGVMLLGIAHRLRNNFKAFSSVLVGGGIAVLYLTIAIAFHEYTLFSQTVAFILMLIITGFAVVLSIGYDRMELAILAILGGFGSPFMVSTGEGNFVVLFTYIALLDAGMLVLAYFKKWNPVNVICYVFTFILFASWLGARYEYDQQSMLTGGFMYATLFYFIFFAMNIVNDVKERTKFKALEISMLLTNTFGYYGAGMVLLDNPVGSSFQGLFTVLLGVFNFGFAYGLFRYKNVDRNLVFLLIGLVLTFVSLAAPVQLEGNYITLFWAAESVLLLWLSQKSGIAFMKIGSAVVMALMLISLAMDWTQVYDSVANEHLPVIFNKGYMTSVVAVLAMGLVQYLFRFEKTEGPDWFWVYGNALKIASLIFLYLSQFLELRYQLYTHDFTYATQNVIIGCFNVLFILFILLSARRQIVIPGLDAVLPFLGFLVIALFLFFYQAQIIHTRYEYLNGGSIVGFAFHYVLILLMAAVAGLTLVKIQKLTAFNARTHNVYAWIYVLFFVFMLSAELDHTVLLVANGSQRPTGYVLEQNHKIGFPILWGLSSFALIAIGLRTKKRHLRIISLTLLLITLVKLFAVDIRGISEGGKIAAFISLGILLLVVSFMYQKLKRFLLADEISRNEEA